MAKPRIFISSTYYDLKHIRNSLENFISQFNYESVLFESGDIAFHHTQALDESCYSEIENCHMLALIIGGRYGSSVTDNLKADNLKTNELDKTYKSITKKEYETARKKNIPIYIFVEKSVMAEYQTYKENKNNDSIIYAHVDSVGVFQLLDEIFSQSMNNLVKEFEKFEDISNWLKDQWAGLFADLLSKKSSNTTLNNLSSQVEELKQLSNVLKSYNESIIKAIEPEKSEKIISASDKKLKLLSVKRFSREPIISYLIGSGNELSPLELFKNFENTTTIKELMQKMKLPKEFQEKFIKEHGQDAQSEYEKLKEDYFGKNI